MAAGCVVRKNQYYDSVFLMRVTQTLSEVPGVQECAVVMGTEANKELLVKMGVRASDLTAATPNDLMVAIVAGDESPGQPAAGRDGRTLNRRFRGSEEFNLSFR